MGRKRKSYYRDENYDSEYFKQGASLSSKYVRQLFNNNSFLLKKAGLKAKEQIAYLKQQGIKMRLDTMRKYKCGMIKTCSIAVLVIFAKYWDISLLVLMGNDFESIEKLEGKEMSWAELKNQ